MWPKRRLRPEIDCEARRHAWVACPAGRYRVHAVLPYLDLPGNVPEAFLFYLNQADKDGMEAYLVDQARVERDMRSVLAVGVCPLPGNVDALMAQPMLARTLFISILGVSIIRERDLAKDGVVVGKCESLINTFRWGLKF